MKKIVLAVIAAFALTGCFTKPYVDVKTNNYATIQLVPESETLLFKDEYYAFLRDYRILRSKKECDYDNSNLGIIETDSDTPSRIAKITAEKPILLNVNYTVRSGQSTFTEYTNIWLRPAKHRHYIVVYKKKSINLFRSVSDFAVYEKRGNKRVRVPSSRVATFDYDKACGKR
jgi:hypothetical protein